MEFEQVVRERYSCRRYSAEPVPKQTIQRILDVAQQTPSWCNCQPWHVLVVSGEAIERFRAKLHAHAAQGSAARSDFAFPLRYEGIYRERRKVCGVQLYQALGIGREDKAGAAQQSLENFRFFGAPHVALITTEEALGVYGAVDCWLVRREFHARRTQSRRGVDRAGCTGVLSGFHPRLFQLAAGAQVRLRHFLRLRGSRASDQRVPHRARQRSRIGDLGRVAATLAVRRTGGRPIDR